MSRRHRATALRSRPTVTVVVPCYNYGHYAKPSLAFVYGLPIECSGEFPSRGKVRSWTTWRGEEWIERRCRTGANCIHRPEVVMRSEVQMAIGGYDPALPHSGDFEMWMRAASVGAVGRVNGPTQAYYRRHAKSMQHTAFSRHLADLEGRLAAFGKVLVGPAARLEQGEGPLALAQKALSMSALRYVRSACLHGRTATEPIEDHLVFAAQTWPMARETRSWRLALRALDSPTRPEPNFPLRARRFAEHNIERARWHRWRWTGV